MNIWIASMLAVVIVLIIGLVTSCVAIKYRNSLRVEFLWNAVSVLGYVAIYAMFRSATSSRIALGITFISVIVAITLGVSTSRRYSDTPEQ